MNQLKFIFRNLSRHRLYTVINITGLFIAFTAALLMYGFVVYPYTQLYEKEIALRKVNGASEKQIVGLLHTVFPRQIIGARMTSLPIAYIGCQKWLEGFAYKIEITVWIYICAVTVTVLIVMLTTNWQILAAARTNPVETPKKV